MSPMPSRGGSATPPVQSPQGASPSTLAGGDPEAGPDQGSESSPDDMSANFIKQVRNLHTTIDAMARQFPEFAKAAREAQDALTKGMSAVVSKQRTPQQGGATPPVG